MEYENELEAQQENTIGSFSSDYGGFISFDDDTCLYQPYDGSPFV